MFLVLVAILLSPASGDDPIVVTGKEHSARDQRDRSLSTERIEPAKSISATTSAGQLIDSGLGTRVQRSGSEGRTEMLQLRGAGANQVAIFLDEVPLMTGRGNALDLSTLPIDFIDRIEIVRGPAASAYGGGAQGGIIHLKTNPKRAPRMSSVLRTGAFGFIQAAVGGSDHNDAGDQMGVVRFERADGEFPYRDTNGRSGRRFNNQHLRFGALGRSRWKPNAHDEITGIIETMFDNRGEPGSAQFPSLDAHSSRMRVMNALNWRNPGIRAGRLPVSLQAFSLFRRFEFNNPSPSFMGEPTFFSMDDNTFGIRGTASWEGHRTMRPRIQFEARRERAGTISQTRQTEHRLETRLQGAIATTLEWYPNRPFSLVLMNRIDLTENQPLMVVPKAGLTWKLNQNMLFRMNGGRTFRMPSFDELYFRSLGISGNPELRPEDGYGADLGLTFLTLKRTLSLQCVGFYQYFERLILFLPLDAWRTQASDAHGAQVAGLEAGLRWKAKRFILKGNYLFQHARFLGTGNNPLPHRPAHRGQVEMGMKLKTSIPFVRASAQSGVFTDPYGNRTLDGYGIVDTGWQFKPTKNWSITAELRNALNAQGLFDAIHQPLPGRRFIAEVKWLH